MGMSDEGVLLAAFDEQMRLPSGSAPAGVAYERDGSVVRVVGSVLGRVRAPRDVGVRGAELDRLIVRQREFFAARGQGVEWMVRAHDRPADLGERLVAAGFEVRGSTTVLVGVAGRVAAEPVLPEGVVLRRVEAVADFVRIADQQSEVWGFDCSWLAGDLAGRVAADVQAVRVFVVEAGDRLACTAWVLFPPGADFAVLLGGTTLPEWQGRGLYRALLAVRAREAVARGYRWLQVDASADSAPILRRSGFRELTTSAHYRWMPSV